MTEAILWLGLIELIGLLALPLTFQVFRALPERGYTLAKPLGLLVVAYVVWLLSMTFGGLGLGFSVGLAWVVLVGGFGLLNVWLLVRRGGELRRKMSAWLSQHRWLVVIVELIFVAAYFYLVNLRSYMPEIRDQEKFGDYALMLSMVKFEQMPPADPWMSGYLINYYYFSHFMMAMLTKMTGIMPAIAFNLTVPLVFAMTALGSFGIVYNLIRMRLRPSEDTEDETAVTPKRLRAPYLFGGLALLLICIMGNLDTVRQIFFPRPPSESGIGGNFAFSWWTPSRVIRDYMPNGTGGYRIEETINEFPMFSFLLADMHPHVMTLPFAVLVVGIALATWRTAADGDALNFRKAEGWLLFGVSAIAIGSLYFLNTWDFPTYLLLVIAATFLRTRQLGSLETLYKRPYRVWLGRSVGLVVVSLALYLPFHLTFISLVGDNPVPEPIGSVPVLGSIARIISFVAWDRTPLLGYLLVFGLFMLPLLSLLVFKLWPYLINPYAYTDEPGYDELKEKRPDLTLDTYFYVTAGGLLLLLLSEIGFHLLRLDALITVFLGFLSIPVIAVGAAGLAFGQLWRLREGRATLKLLSAIGVLIALMTLGGWLLRFELYGPLIAAGTFTGLLVWFESKRKSEEWKVKSDEQTTSFATPPSSLIPPHSTDLFALLLLLLPIVINFGTELIIIRDVFNSRLNTLFKFYYQSWVLYGLAAAYASWLIIAWLWKLAPFENEHFEGEGDESELERDEEEALRQPQPPKLAPQRMPQPQATLRLSPAGGPAFGSGQWAFTMAAPTNNTPEYRRYEDEWDDAEAEEAEEYAMSGPSRPWWRWLWALGLGLVLVGGLIYPTFGPYEKAGRFANRVGLDGSQWLSKGSPTGAPLSQDYEAISWLNGQLAADKNFAGTILETTEGDWVDFSRVSTFTGMPTLMGWWGHENQWRGGKADARAGVFDCGHIMRLAETNPAVLKSGNVPPPSKPSQQKSEPYCRKLLVDLLYSTPDPQLAESLLKIANVRYVYVGMLETGVSNGRGEGKAYPAEGLVKFGQFMKVIYEVDGIRIYSF